MPTERKAVKVISLLTLAWALIALIFDVVSITVATTNGWNSDNVIMIVSQTVIMLLSFYVGMRGVKGANVPSKIGSYTASALILMLLLAILVIFMVAVNVRLGFSMFAQELPFFIFITAGLIMNLVGWVYGRKILAQELSK